MPEKSFNKLTIRSYGCIKDVSIDLCRLHALIGPNDSGKSTILRAMSTLVKLATSRMNVANQDLRLLQESALKSNFLLDITFKDNHGYRLEHSPGPDVEPIFESIHSGNAGRSDAGRSRIPSAPGILERAEFIANSPNAIIYQRLASARMLRLDPDALRSPSRLIPDGQLPSTFDERGTGLSGIYDAIVNRDVESFLNIQVQVRELFPTIRRLQLKNVSHEMKALEIELIDGQRIAADLMSEGLLYYLAFAALPHIERTSVLLVEEPENGLHPARIAEVMRILKEISRTTQVIIATHSPLVVNELEPEQVSVVIRRPEEGTRVTPIKDTPNFEERSKVYALGELWLSYADGTYEEPLLSTPKVEP